MWVLSKVVEAGVIFSPGFEFLIKSDRLFKRFKGIICIIFQTIDKSPVVESLVAVRFSFEGLVVCTDGLVVSP